MHRPAIVIVHQGRGTCTVPNLLHMPHAAQCVLNIPPAYVRVGLTDALDTTAPTRTVVVSYYGLPYLRRQDGKHLINF